jgi:hypothetical protein
MTQLALLQSLRNPASVARMILQHLEHGAAAMASSSVMNFPALVAP